MSDNDMLPHLGYGLVKIYHKNATNIDIERVFMRLAVLFLLMDYPLVL